MKLRCLYSQREPMPRPIHRIIWESILYQIFRQTVRRPFAIDFEPDVEFCARAEKTLQALTFPDLSPADNSPVIGFPLPLQRLIIEVVQLCKHGTAQEAYKLQRLSTQMRYWESTIVDEEHCTQWDKPLSKTSASERARSFHHHSTSLHILAASLLLDWATMFRWMPVTGELPPPRDDAWQVDRGLRIMQCPEASEDWSRCYLGSWPSLILGYAVNTPEHIALIRDDLEKRFQKLCSGDERIFLVELEFVWRLRGISATSGHDRTDQ